MIRDKKKFSCGLVFSQFCFVGFPETRCFQLTFWRLCWYLKTKYLIHFSNNSNSNSKIIVVLFYPILQVSRQWYDVSLNGDSKIQSDNKIKCFIITGHVPCAETASRRWTRFPCDVPGASPCQPVVSLACSAPRVTLQHKAQIRMNSCHQISSVCDLRLRTRTSCREDRHSWVWPDSQFSNH